MRPTIDTSHWRKLAARGARRYAPALLISTVVHAGALLVFASASVRPAPPPSEPVPVTIREAAPPLPAPAAKVVAVPATATREAIAAAKPAQPKLARVHAARPVRRQPETSWPVPVAEAVANAVAGGRGADGMGGGGPYGQAGGMPDGHGDQTWRAGEVAAPPVALSHPMPQYPPLARVRGVEGLVVLEAIVDREGRIETDGLRVVRSVAMLDEAAITAFRQWRFQPGRNGQGQPVRVVLQVPIRFQLR